MENLIESLSTSFKVDDRPNNTTSVHPMYSEYYKFKGDTSNQASRRKAFLEAQKKKRDDVLNAARNISDSDSDDDLDQNKYQHKDATYRKNSNISSDLCNLLMDSEWLVDVPEDLNTQWTAVPCPIGKRCLLVSHGKTTCAYDKNGRKFLSFPSWLPAGSSAELKLNKGVANSRTVLDCIYSFAVKTFFIVDAIEWNSHTFLNCETTFRFFWLSSRIQEIKGLEKISKVNPYSIRLLPRFPVEELESKMSHYPLLEETDPQIDGVLFFHNESHYTPGSSPLVGWLKPFMVSEMLKVETHIVYKIDIPPNYKNAAQYIKADSLRSDSKLKAQAKKAAKQKDTVSKPELPLDPLGYVSSINKGSTLKRPCDSNDLYESYEGACNRFKKEKSASSFKSQENFVVVQNYSGDKRPSSPLSANEICAPKKKNR